MARTSRWPSSAAGEEASSVGIRDGRLWILTAFTIGIAVGAQLIGPLTVPVGVASVTLLPMIWAFLTGGVISSQGVKPLPLQMQQASASLMTIAVLLLVTRLSFSIGPQIEVLVAAGPVLLLQEVGHFTGTILFALPLAVLLRMGPATIGATFSIDREPAFAMVSARYGPESPQHRGVLAVYVYGSLFGAVVVSLGASLAGSLGIFDPRALALGAGVGSTSMMAAAAASIIAAYPESGEEILAFAAASNVITNVVGVYLGVWVALPLADRLYYVLTRTTPPTQSAPESDATVDGPATTPTRARPSFGVPIVLVTSLAVTAVSQHQMTWRMVLAYAVFAVMLLTGLGIDAVSKGKIPALITVTTLGALLSSPVSPLSTQLLRLTESTAVVPLTTVLLTLAGLGIGKDLQILRRIGWKILPVGTVALVASFILAAVIGEVALRLLL